VKLNHEYAPAGHGCTCPCHGGAQLFEYLPCCKYEGMLNSPTEDKVKLSDDDWQNNVKNSADFLSGLIPLVRKMNPQRIAEDICDVQPMPNDLMKRTMEAAKDEKWLIENGYEPVSHHRLMWTKKHD